MIINLTPHDVSVHTGSGIVTIPRSGIVARVSEARRPGHSIEHDGHTLLVEESSFGEVVDLPSPEAGVHLLVSALVRSACPDRPDLVSPGPLVRDADGRAVGCRGLTR